MLSFRKETDYAIQFLLYIAKDPDNCHSLKKFADETGISFYFMQKIARKLSKESIIQAQQGVCGGYILKANPKKLTLYDVAYIMEKGVRLMACVEKTHTGCNNNIKHCKVKKIVCKLNSKFTKAMKEIKILEI